MKISPLQQSNIKATKLDKIYNHKEIINPIKDKYGFAYPDSLDLLNNYSKGGMLYGDCYIVDNEYKIKKREALEAAKKYGDIGQDANSISRILNEYNVDFGIKLMNSEDLYLFGSRIASILKCISSPISSKLAEELFSTTPEVFYNSRIGEAFLSVNDDNFELAVNMSKVQDPDFSIFRELISQAPRFTGSEEKKKAFADFAFKAIQNKRHLEFLDAFHIFPKVNNENLQLASQLVLDKDSQVPLSFVPMLLAVTTKNNVSFACDVCSKIESESYEDWANVVKLLKETNEVSGNLAKELCFGEEKSPLSIVADILANANQYNVRLLERLHRDKTLEFPQKYLPQVAKFAQKSNIGLMTQLCTDVENRKKAEENGDFLNIVYSGINYEQYFKLRSVFGNVFKKMNLADTALCAKLIDFYEQSSIEGLSSSQRRELLDLLTTQNSDILRFAAAHKKEFPFLSSKKDEYEKLIKELIFSLKPKSKKIDSTQINKMFQGLQASAELLANMSDEEFNSLIFSQTYPKEDFLVDLTKLLKDLDKNSQEVLLDYFDFQIIKNESSKSGYSILGFPKIPQDKPMKDGLANEVEKISKLIIRFNKQNELTSNNAPFATSLNQILDAFPELRTSIGKIQHSAQDFDIFKHSLKVMQKIIQNPEFESLDEKDKKIILLASLFHDISKSEGEIDSNHAEKSAFDSYFIFQKLGLSREEENKLYTLIKTHEWLKQANSSLSNKDKAIKSIAFDLQQDNLFDMAKIFTQADLMAVKKDDSFYITYKNALEELSKQIKELIFTYKASQPLLPMTKFPNASEVEKLITQVNEDGSTNIKGIYKIDGNYILRYSEVEDWEQLGFPSGTTTRGIKDKNNKYDTGNVHFLIHALNQAENLTNFDIFDMPDSDAVLSSTWVDFPEMQKRYYYEQGLILDIDNSSILAGSSQNAGTGRKKTMESFKEKFIFRFLSNQRTCISDLIKKEFGLSDEEYIAFVQKYKNLSAAEIQPTVIADKLIQALAEMQSGVLNDYNEILISKPKVNAAFIACNSSDKGRDIRTILQRKPEFIKRYARNNDLLLVVFNEKSQDCEK